MNGLEYRDNDEGDEDGTKWMNERMNKYMDSFILY